MITADPNSVYCLRTPPENDSDTMLDSLIEDETEKKTIEDEEYILCRQCMHVITSPAERIVVDGSHRHTFANPHGIVFEIGCFGSVIGCGYAGSPTGEFTWFKGFSWRVAVCIRCLSHLGWLFTSSGFESFHGLVLDRLITQSQSSLSQG